MTNYNLQRTIFLLVCVFCLALTTTAQNPFDGIVLKKNTDYLSAKISGFSELVINSPDNGTVNLIDVSGGFKVKYTPDSNYTGKDTIIVEYLTSGNAPSIAFALFTFDVRHSIINLVNDHYAVSSNSPYAYFNVGANDTGSDAPISVSSVITEMGGYAYISQDSLFFKPKPNFEGIAVVSYRACDTLGYCAIGQAQFIVVDSANLATEDTLVLFTAENVEVQILMPDTGFSASVNPGLGILHNDQNGQVFTYQPLQNTNGADTFEMSNADSILRHIIVNIIDVPEVNERVVPDYIYTHKNTTVTFDVLDNDIVSTGRVSSYTGVSNGTLTKISSRDFEYIPDSAFEGVDKFTYTTCVNGSNCETTVVKIYVGNLNPDNQSNYDLVTPKNRPIVINYDVPISNFMFQLAQSPTNGTLTIYPGYDTLTIGCEVVKGHNLAVYQPDTNYVGFDEFDLEYCVDSNDCQLVKVKIDVLDMQLDSVCVCADDCVWPGDVDYDGEVNMMDLLSLGWNIGAEGSARPYAEPNNWYGQYCPDWDQSQLNNENLKHADSDGDGIITVADTSGIVNFYNKVHSILTEPNFEPAEYPISLEIESPNNPQIGDFVLVNVLAGSSDYPAYNLHGLHLNLDFDPNVIDTSSLVMNFMPHSWILNYDACVDLTRKDGSNLQGGISRIDGRAKSGFGIVAQVGFIVEDDIDGLKLENGILNYNIELTNSSVMLGNGEILHLKNKSVPLRIKLPRNPQPQNEELIVYPNPAPDHLNMALNGGTDIENLQVYDLTGRLMYTEEGIGSRFHSINTRTLKPGIYILKTITSSGMSQSIKFQVFR